MVCTLHYGLNSALEVEPRPQTEMVDLCQPEGVSQVDPAMALKSALAAPLNYPPLSAAAVPGDRVVIGLAAGVPQAAAIVAGIVDHLLAGGVSAEDITVLATHDDAQAGAPDPRSALPQAIRGQVRHVVHEPENREHLSYLATTEAGHTVYLNRLVPDADLLVSIGCARFPGAAGYFGMHSSLFPTFSDAPTQKRFRRPSGKAKREDRRAVAEVGWLLGAVFAIQVVPGESDSVLEVLAGDAMQVYPQSEARAKAAWQRTVERRAPLVVVGIAGGPNQQTWENVGRALAAASAAVTDDGAIALCTDLAVAPGPGVGLLAAVEDPDDAMQHVRKRRPPDVYAAVRLAEALTRARVFLLSELEESQVEELGMAPVSNPSELQRLIGRYPACILIGGAQYAAIVPPEE